MLRFTAHIASSIWVADGKRARSFHYGYLLFIYILVVLLSFSVVVF